MTLIVLTFFLIAILTAVMFALLFDETPEIVFWLSITWPFSLPALVIIIVIIRIQENRKRKNRSVK